jgi:hypothetical protein
MVWDHNSHFGKYYHSSPPDEEPERRREQGLPSRVPAVAVHVLPVVPVLDAAASGGCFMLASLPPANRI